MDLHLREFEQTFTRKVTDRLVSALRGAYDTACEHHVPNQGSNEVTFGFNLYHHAVHELVQTEDGDLGIRLLSRHPTFRLAVGDFELCCHRVGYSAGEDIRYAFPKNEGAACTMVESQLWLPTMAPAASVQQARKLVIAHLGNADDGLGAIYLCIADRTDGERIVSWAFTHLLWKADDQQMMTDADADAAVPDEVVEEPVVQRKKKTAHGSEA